MRRIAFKALDDEIVAFDVPRGVNHRLVLKAVQRVHESGDAAIPPFLTKTETEFVARVVAELEAHRPEAK